MVCVIGQPHRHPVHFNRGRHGHVWLCLSCGKQLSGPSLPLDEKEALIEFAKLYNEDFKSRKGLTARKEQGEMTMETMMSITIKVPQNADNASIAAALRMRAGIFEGMPIKAAASRKNTDAAPVAEEVDETPEADEDEDFAPKKKTAGKKAAAAAFDDDADEDTSGAIADDEEEDEGFMEAPAKKAPAKKAKKLTVDDVNDACKERAARTGGKEGRAEVLALLKKNFKTASVSEVKPEDYEKLVKIMKA
jgi:hypothetical protein